MQFLNHPATLICFGLLVGIFSGIMGLGGGTMMIPIMVLVYQMNQRQANGTSLAVMILPVLFLPVWQYHRDGNVNWHMVMYIALGFLVGGLPGALIANKLIGLKVLKLVFAFVLIYAAGNMIFGSTGLPPSKTQLVRTMVLAFVLVGCTGVAFAALRWYDRQGQLQSQQTLQSPPPAIQQAAIASAEKT